MTLKEKKDAIFERAKNGVKQIPTHTIVSEYVELKKDGIHYKGFCPFHSSKTMNSFRVTDSKNYYKCFGCDAGGTGVGFVADYKGISYHDALFYVAQEYGIISSEEYDLMMEKKAVTQKPREKKSFKKIDIAQEKQKANPCSIKIKNDVYDFMKEFFGLSEEHRNHLKNVRHLSDEAIEKDFFSLVEEKKEAFIKALKIKFSYSVEELMNVPGFFYEKEHSCLRMANYEGIGILIRGLDGYIKAVQVRKDKDEPDKPRYVWFASNFVFKYPQFYKGGNGTGSPVDLLYPAVMKKKYAVGICEGKFKGEILAQQGLFAISVQGVGNWKGGELWSGVDHEIDQLDSFSTLGIDTIYIFYDADMMSNTGVFGHAMKLGEYLEKRYPHMKVVYALWHDGYGKGIDDLYINGHANDIRYMSRKPLQETQQELDIAVTDALGISKYPKNKIPAELKEKYIMIMQGLMESALL